MTDQSTASSGDPFHFSSLSRPVILAGVTPSFDDPTDTSIPIPHAATRAGQPRGRPGLVVVWERGAPVCRAIAFDGDALEVGRSPERRVALADGSVSRLHARVAWSPAGLAVEDLGSRHGTFVDGRPAQGARASTTAVLRFGATLALATDDVAPFEARGVVSGSRVLGPAMQAALEAVPQAARAGVPLLVQGESGTGKDDVAHLYHRACARHAGALVELNTASIPRDLVEAELFGTRRGAYSGAVDRDGAFVRADRGTLFFDELGELPLEVQPKLLRALEARRVVPLGGDAARAFDVRFVSATHRDLDAMVATGTFRQDLLARLSHERVRLPPLRERREEVPHLVALGLARAWDVLAADPLPASATFIEACCLRGWRGENVRGLLACVGSAARAALRDQADAVHASHLPAEGSWAAPAADAPAPLSPAAVARAARQRAFHEVVQRCGGDLRAAAADFGVSLATAYRWMGRG